MRMTTEMADAFGYDPLGNAAHLLSPQDAAALQAGDYRRAGGQLVCRCGVTLDLHPSVQGAIWLTRACDGLVKL